MGATSRWQVVDIGKVVGGKHRRLVRVYGKQVSKCWIVSPSNQGQIKWIKLRILKINDGKFIAIICT